MSKLKFQILKDKKIILGVSGSIAAYKSAVLVRLFVKAGALVKVIMTKSAADFISPLTLSTLSKNEVVTDLQNESHTAWNNHVELGLWADIMLIAPASANTIAKMANGICDNMLLATYLSAKCPVFFAPAMDLDMRKHKSTENNIALLQSYGNQLIHTNHGELASGLVGDGRMAEPEEIVEILNSFFSQQLSLKGKHVLITAGPTYEAIDPVRFIGNHSSGKMGFALAECAAERGAKVTLVSGPTSLKELHSNINRINIISAEEMYKAVVKHYKSCDVAILSAAVADFTPQQTAKQKIKKEQGLDTIKLKTTLDILAELGKKKKHQLLVGFALETNNEVENAKKKLKNKKLDCIVLNSLNDKEAGFGKDTNKISILDKYNKMKNYEAKSKKDVASDILDYVELLLKLQQKEK